METLSVKKQRNSNIELLKIISMVVIVFSHQIVPYYYDGIGGIVDFPGAAVTTDPQFLFLSFIGPLGLFADVVFIACSAYFLLESNRISVKKVFFLMASDVIIMSSSLIVQAAIGDEISEVQILEAIFPTFLQVNWFVGYYIVFYLLHPFFNYVIRKLDKKGLAIVTLILVVQCNVILFGMGDRPGAVGLKFLCFVSIYFAVAFSKLYGAKLWESKKFNVCMLCLATVLYVAFRISMNYIGLVNEYVAERQDYYAHINNPIIIVWALAAINLATRKPRYNKVINYFSGMTLLMYLVHQRLLFQSRSGYMEYFLNAYGVQNFWLAVLSLCFIVLGLTLALSVLYRHTAYYGVMALGGVVEKGVYSACEKLKAKVDERKNKKENRTEQSDECPQAETILSNKNKQDDNSAFENAENGEE